jgi:hypothetical protein
VITNTKLLKNIPYYPANEDLMKETEVIPNFVALDTDAIAKSNRQIINKIS